MEQQQIKKKRKLHPIFIIFIIIFIAAGIYAAYHEINLRLPNSEQIPFRQYFTELKQDGIYIVLEDKLAELEHLPIEKDNKVFLPAGFVKQYIDKYIFWDENADRLTYTTDYEVTRFSTSDDNFYKDGMCYMSAKLIMELYNVDISFNKTNNIVIVDYKEQSRNISKIAAKTADLRYEPDKKSPIEEKLLMDTEVVSYSEQDGYSLVRTSDGLLGYVLTKDIVFDRTTEKTAPEEIAPYKPNPVAKNGKINILWEQVFTAEKSADEATRIAYDGLDVLCPTWFSFDKSLNGDIIDFANKSYVDWAHENDMQVWGLITDNFDEDVAHFILGDSLKREYVIEQLLELISVYELDGINIDFENVRKADAEYYIQFIRELAPFLKERGVVLSVDMYVPKPYSMYYNRTEVGKSADFVIIMAYDEYHRTGGESGPLASIGFVEEGISETLKEVPKEKIILGIPYYNRVWNEIETDEGIRAFPDDTDYGMTYPYVFFTENGAEFKWDDETKNYYAEYIAVEDGVELTKRLWLEDERSVEEKLKLVAKYDIAGIAGWKKGLEKEIIWDLLYEYLK